MAFKSTKQKGGNEEEQSGRNSGGKLKITFKILKIIIRIKFKI